MRRPDSFIGGIDVCAEDGSVGWDLVKTTQVLFAMVKATEGGDNRDFIPDPAFLQNVREAYLNGLRVGAYHYLTATTPEEAKLQADGFLEVIRQAGIMINFYCGVVVPDWDDIEETDFLVDIFTGIVETAGYKSIVHAPLEALEKLRFMKYAIWLPYSGGDFDSLPALIRKNTVLWQHRPMSSRGFEEEVFRSALVKPEALFSEVFSTVPIRYVKGGRPAVPLRETTEWAIRRGILQSDTGEFNMKETIRREELLILLRRFYDLWRAYEN